MKLFLILLSLLAVLFSFPVVSQVFPQLSPSSNTAYRPLFNEVIPPVLKTDKIRLKTLAFPGVCQEQKEIQPLPTQKIIKRDLHASLQNAMPKYSLFDDQIIAAMMMVVNFIEGFRAGYEAAVQATLVKDEALNKLCAYAKQEVIKALKKP